MSAMTISFVLVRLAATFLFVRGIQGLAAFGYLLTSELPVSGYGAFTLVFGVLLPTGIAMVLWTWPEKITGAEQKHPGTADAVTAEQVLAIGLSLLGLYVLVYGVADLIAGESAHLFARRHAPQELLPDLQEVQQTVASRVRYVSQILLGLALLACRNGVSSLLLRARYAGVGRTAARSGAREDRAGVS